jgi:hypothetical protein
MKCPTVNCDETVSDSSKKLYCKNCRSSMYYWSRKPPGAVLRRAKMLKKYEDRISNRKDGKVNRA